MLLTLPALASNVNLLWAVDSVAAPAVTALGMRSARPPNHQCKGEASIVADTSKGWEPRGATSKGSAWSEGAHLGGAQNLGCVVWVPGCNVELKVELASPANSIRRKLANRYTGAPLERICTRPPTHLYIPSSGRMEMMKCMSLSFPSGKLIAMLEGRLSSAMSGSRPTLGLQRRPGRRALQLVQKNITFLNAQLSCCELPWLSRRRRSFGCLLLVLGAETSSVRARRGQLPYWNAPYELLQPTLTENSFNILRPWLRISGLAKGGRPEGAVQQVWVLGVDFFIS